MKLSFHWTSTVPKRYKKNVFIGALHCFNSLLISLISLNFEEKVWVMKDKEIKAGYHFRFIKPVINDFNQEKIPASSFEERKQVGFQIYLCKQNEN